LKRSVDHRDARRIVTAGVSLFLVPRDALSILVV